MNMATLKMYTFLLHVTVLSPAAWIVQRDYHARVKASFPLKNGGQDG